MTQTGELVSRAPMAPSRPASAGGSLVQMDKAAIMERVRVIHSIMEQVMVEGHHYFTFGNTKRKFRMDDGSLVEREVPQYSLGKAGAEVVCLTFGLTPDLDSTVVADDPTAPRVIQVSEWVDDPSAGSRGRRKIIKDQTVTGYYEVKSTCAIWSNHGTLLARASGSCNSCETAFVNQGYSNVKNSILKRAEKRAMVAAVLMASGAGDVFVQDLEDTPTAIDGPSSAPMSQAPRSSAPATGGAPAGGAAPSGWLSDPQKKLLFAKGKNQVPPASEEVIRHIIHVLDGMPKSQAKPYFDAIADGKPQGAELWAQARHTVETAAAKAAGAGPGGEVPAEPAV